MSSEFWIDLLIAVAIAAVILLVVYIWHTSHGTPEYRSLNDRYHDRRSRSSDTGPTWGGDGGDGGGDGGGGD